MASKTPTSVYTDTAQTDTPDLLPNFCDNRVLLTVLLIAEALAIVLTLGQGPGLGDIWIPLGNTSLFVLSIALIDTAILCFTRQYIKNLTPVTRILLVYFLLQLVTIGITLIAHYVIGNLTPGLDNGVSLSLTITRNISISLIVTGVMLRYFFIRHHNKLRRRAEDQAHIQALQARIRPHFLFNSLNTIANLIHQQPDIAEEAILDLAELFRSTLTKSTHITLGEELDIAKRYLHIEELRLGDRLKLSWDIDNSAMTIGVPALIIQPLVENAVYHGIEPLESGGQIDISVQLENKRLIIKISNPFPTDSHSKRTSGNQLAINNIQQRLLLAYAQHASLDISKSGSRYNAILSLPVRDVNYEHSDR